MDNTTDRGLMLSTFFKKKTFPNHGNLFELLTSKINIKKYAEFNSPFNEFS